MQSGPGSDDAIHAQNPYRRGWPRFPPSRAVNARIVTAFAISARARDERGVWIPDQARAFLAYTHSIGGTIAAAEFFNEPSFAAMGAAPPGYDAASCVAEQSH